MAGSEIIVCGKRFNIGHPVITFEDSDGFNAYIPHRTDNISEIYASKPAPGLKQRMTRYRQRRLMGGSDNLQRLKQVVRQIVIHLDGCLNARMCFEVLHNERGLSVHFLVDNDGTIYQTLDLLHCAFHAGGVNEISVGIEMQNRGDAARYPRAYPRGTRSIVTCRIHGVQFLAYDFTEAQYQAMIRLCRALTYIFNIPLISPQQEGQPLWTLLPDFRSFRGVLGHYHICPTKWDPGPWDFQRLLRSIGSQFTLPLTSINQVQTERSLDRWGSSYFESSEQDVDAHFPIGPLGESRLWHGGVHLKGQEESAPVYAVLRGQIVAARMGPPCPIGSCNFVLIRHTINLAKIAWTVFSLYYHLAWATEITEGEEGISWLRHLSGRKERTTLERGEIAMLDFHVEAGDVIGRIGEAGPSGYREEQIHFAIFSGQEKGQELDPGYWELIEGDNFDRFCTNHALISRIDRPSGSIPADGLISRRELRNFFLFRPQRTELRRMVVHHRSEWTTGDWIKDLNQSPDFAALSPARRRRLIEQQILPGLWWTPEVARHVGLPTDEMIYSYHPIGFLLWTEQMLNKYSNVRSAGIEGVDRWEGKLPPTHLTVDSESGSEMTDEEDYYSGEHGKNLTLEDIVNGYSNEP